MHSLLKESELVWMTGVGHMPNLEREDEFNTTLAAFLRPAFARTNDARA